MEVRRPSVKVRDVTSKGSLVECCKARGSRADVEALIANKADPNERDHKGSSILMHAVWFENLDIIMALLDAGVRDMHQLFFLR